MIIILLFFYSFFYRIFNVYGVTEYHANLPLALGLRITSDWKPALTDVTVAKYFVIATLLSAVQSHVDSYLCVQSHLFFGRFQCRESTDQPAFDDLVAKVTSLAPTIDLPWLSFERSLASDDAGESPPAAGDPEGESPERGGRESSPEVDYSYLYIYKHDSGASGDAKPLAESGTKPGVKLDAAETFIALASSADESDSDQGEGARRDVGRGGKRGGGRGRGLKRYMDRTTVPDRGTQKATNRPKYLTANVKQVYQNVNRKEFSGKHANKNVVLVDYK